MTAPPAGLSIGTRRKAIVVTGRDLVTQRPLRPDDPFPLVIEPNVRNADLVSWVDANRSDVETSLHKHGAILFRNWQLGSSERLEEFLRAATGQQLIDYSYRSTPRTQVSGKIYTSTEYPPEQVIPLHNEMSYSTRWPMKIAFYSVTPAESGGATPIADSRRVYNRIDERVRSVFAEKKVLYVRNYSKGLDVPWQEVFGTSSKAEVEQFCRDAGIEVEWKGADALRTRQVCQAVVMHPQTREPVWFNQAHLFHISNVAQEMREKLLKEFAEEDFPRNTYFGDGSPIPESMLEEIRRAYAAELVPLDWQPEDVALLDNVLVAHGRMPYRGKRRVLVGMAEPFESRD